VESEPTTFAEWQVYFCVNRESLLRIPWGSSHRLTKREKLTIMRSIQTFQPGESSEGRHFLKRARDYATRSGDHAYVDALKLFIAEEQRHARDLGRFMRQEDIPLARNRPSDWIFRRLRQLAGLQTCVVVLLTAELYALLYYDALRAATRSPALRRLCTQILRDEVRHIQFQSQTLGMLRRSFPQWLRSICIGLQRVLFWGTCQVVWMGHHRVLRAGGFTLPEFSFEAGPLLEAALRMSGEPDRKMARQTASQGVRAQLSIHS